MLAGEYAVLSGGRALVMAVDRCVVARPARGETAAVPREVRATLEAAAREGVLRKTPVAMEFDASELYGPGGHKLGLGSSAAAAVAALALATAMEGVSLPQEEIGRIARDGHREAQGGGSGVDVMTSALGGVVRFDPRETPWAQRVSWSDKVPWGVLWAGVSARTSEMLAKVEAQRGTDRWAKIERCIGSIDRQARMIEAAAARGDAGAVLEAVRDHGRCMQELGTLADVAIVTDAMAQLAARIEPLGAAMKPSGAGGGDVVLVVANSQEALTAAIAQGTSLGFAAVSLSPDARGVRVTDED